MMAAAVDNNRDFVIMKEGDDDEINDMETESPGAEEHVAPVAAAAAAAPTTATTTTTTTPSQTALLMASLPANRFELELEFLQSLASPAYLHYLATAPEKYLQDPHFMAFLRYLKYWKQPEYARLISYPHALYMLDLLLLHYDDTITNATTAEEMTVADGNNITALENPSSQIMEPAKAATSSSASNPTFMNVVARELVNVSFRNFIHQQQFFSWQYRALHLYGGSTTGEEAPFAPPASNCPTEPSSNTAPPDGTSN